MPRARVALLACLAVVLSLLGAGPASGVPERAPGAGSHVLSAAALGDAPGLVPASVPGPRMAGRDAGTGARSAVGNHTIYVLPVYWSGSKPAPVPAATVTSAVAEADTYLRAATGNQITVSFGWLADWTRISLTSSEAASCDLRAITREVRRVVGSGGPREHMVVDVDNPACDWTDLHTFGLTAQGDGYSLSNDFLNEDMFLRAVGHNSGVSGAGSLVCTSGGALVPMSSTCTSVTYTNPWDFLSDHPYGHIGMPTVSSLAGLGVLSATDYVGVTPGATRTVSLLPLEGGTGLRGAWFDHGGYRYSIEYRIPSGPDSWIDDESYTSGTTTRTDPGGGVVLHRQQLGDGSASRDVVDLHATGPVRDPGKSRHPGLAAGESFTSPDGFFAIRVVTATSAGAGVELSFPAVAKVDRWSGADRFATSAQISSEIYGTDVPLAYIASGRVYTDALSGAPVAGNTDGPVLLVDTDAIPAVIAAELTRLAPAKIVILGGPATITPNVESLLQSYTSGQVVRWSGADRYETSAAVSAASFPAGVDTVYVASGQVFTDALSGAPVAGKSGAPVLLVSATSVPASIAAELTRLAPQRIVVLGGPNTISPAIATALEAYAPTVVRIAGADRFTTSTAITAANYSPPTATLYIASGRVYTDALSGAPVAGTMESPILLVDTAALPAATATEIKRLKPTRIVVLGGPNTVSLDVQGALGALLP